MTRSGELSLQDMLSRQHRMHVCVQVRTLHDNANYFRRKLLDRGLHVLGDWDSPVMPIMIYHPAKLPIVSRLCLERGVAVVVVGFPATPIVLTRARVCISAAHTTEDLDYALHVLSEVTDVSMMKYGIHTPLPPPRPHPLDPGSVPPPGTTHPGQRTEPLRTGDSQSTPAKPAAAAASTPVTKGSKSKSKTATTQAAATITPLSKPVTRSSTASGRNGVNSIAPMALKAH